MGTEAPIPADPSTGAPAESTGLSVLDVVKHALRTIISTMQEGKLHVHLSIRLEADGFHPR
jgi:hypothetical protein